MILTYLKKKYNNIILILGDLEKCIVLWINRPIKKHSDYIKEHKSNLLINPCFAVGKIYKNFKAQLQLQYSINIKNPDLEQTNFLLSFDFSFLLKY